MIDVGEDYRSLDLERRIQETLERGLKYAKAFCYLDPTLSQVEPGDLTVGFDVGEGADPIAFRKVSFQKAMVTNSLSAIFQLGYQRTADKEEKISRRLQSHFPENSEFSNLGISDFLAFGIAPRLTTMLSMAPQYFGYEDPAEFLKELTSIQTHIKPGSTVILSASNDHKSSGKAFSEFGEWLASKGIAHRLWLDEAVPPEISVLGQRVLTFSK